MQAEAAEACASTQVSDDDRDGYDHERPGDVSEKPMESETQVAIQHIDKPVTGHKKLWTTWRTGFRRRRHVEQVKRALTPLSAAHGALYESVFIKGPSGSGKRTIALQAAEDICKRDGRTLLVVDGQSFETFIPSYLDTYYALTGSHLPAGEHWFYALYNLKSYLDQHRTEWLMVVLSVESYLDKLLDYPGRTLGWFLPNRGQIIMTSNAYYAIGCGFLRATANATVVQVNTMRRSEISDFARKCCPELADIKAYGSRLGRLGLTMQNLTIIAANLSLLDITLDSYAQMFETRWHQKKIALKKLWSWWFDSEDIHYNIMWEALSNRDRWAGRLLAVVSFINASEIPVELIGRLPIFANTISDQLTPSLSLLQSLNLVKMSPTHVWIDKALHTWLQEFTEKKYAFQEWLVLRDQWATVFTKTLTERNGRDEAFYACWMLGPHIHALHKKVIKHPDLANLDLLIFLAKVSTTAAHRAQILKHAETYTRDAMRMETSHEMSNSAFAAYNYAQARIRLASAIVFADGPGDYTRATTEVRSARRYIDRLGAFDTVKSLREHLWLIQAHVMICQGQFDEAQTFLFTIIQRAQHMTDQTRAKLYHMLAKSLFQTGAHLAALQHSHEATVYWYPRMYSSSPRKTRTAMAVVETHAEILLEMCKYRGALIFIVELLGLKITNSRQHSSSVWKLAKYAVQCYWNIEDIDAAEDLLCRVLSSSGEGGLKEGITYELSTDIPDSFVSHYFDMLYYMGCLYMRFGRFVEAEGVLRYVRDVGASRMLMSNLGPAPYEWWGKLMLCQCWRKDWRGLSETQEASRQIYGKEVTKEDFESFEGRLHETINEVYQSALWAIEDGCYDHWSCQHLRARGVRSSLIVGKQYYGDPEERVADGRVFGADVDQENVARAKRNKLLHLLGFDVVDLAFVSKQADLPPPSDDNEDLRDPTSDGRDGPTLAPQKSKSVSKAAPTIPTLDDILKSGPVEKASNPAKHVTGGGSVEELGGTGSAQASLPLAKDNGKSSESILPVQEENDARAKEDTDAELIDTVPGDVERTRSGGADLDPNVFKLHIMTLWADTYKQKTLPEYWKWCYCRRHRRRSGSINPVDIIDKRFLREIARDLDDEEKPKLVQKQITDCFILLPPEPKPLAKGCHKGCPCHAANERGAKEWEELQRSLHVWTDETNPALDPNAYYPEAVYTGAPRPSGRFKKPKLLPPFLLNEVVTNIKGDPLLRFTRIGDANWELPTYVGAIGSGALPVPASSTFHALQATGDATLANGNTTAPTPTPSAPMILNTANSIPPPPPSPPPTEHSIIVIHDNSEPPQCGTTWRWRQSELFSGDYPDENYLIRNSLTIPRISITLTEDSFALPGTKFDRRWCWMVKKLPEVDDWREVRSWEWARDYQGKTMEVLDSVSLKPTADRMLVGEPHEPNQWLRLTKRKEKIKEYFPMERRFGPTELRRQEERLERVHPHRCEDIFEREEGVEAKEAEEGEEEVRAETGDIAEEVKERKTGWEEE